MGRESLGMDSGVQEGVMAYPKNKYRKGYTIFGIGDLATLLMSGAWVYLDEKAYHPGFILSMQLKYVIDCERGHRFSEAINAQQEYSIREYQKPYPEGLKRD